MAVVFNSLLGCYMACPICDHTMQAIAKRCFWCPRCGTIKLDHEGEMPDIEAPRIVRVLQSVDKTLRVDAAEYVPAIGDAFTLIDELGEKFANKNWSP